LEKDAYYFPHFCVARHDRKIRRLRKELGIEGYGIFFMVLEVLREQIDFKYPIEDLDLLAEEFGTSEAKIRVVVCNYKLFEVDNDEFFFSPKLIVFMQPYLNSKEQRKIAAQRSVEARRLKAQEKDNDRLATVERPLNDRLTNAQQSKVKKSKVNESKVNKSKVNKENIYTSSTTCTLENKENHVVGDEIQIQEGKIFKFFNDNISPITPFQAETINYYLDVDGLTKGLEPKLILEVLKDSLGKSEKWSWANKVLRNCKFKGINTFEEYNFEKDNHSKKPLENKDSDYSKRYPTKIERDPELQKILDAANPPEKNPFIDD
jgi:DnaD/phage-associated family protein